MKKYLLWFFSFIFLTRTTLAHCPLCSIGVAAAAGGAAYLGVSTLIIGLFVGAFAVSTGWWMSRIVRKRWKLRIPQQDFLLIVLSFVLTVVPLLPLLQELKPFYLALFGNYGTLFNRTYLVDLALLTSIFGGLLVIVSPKLSKKISSFRQGRIFPFQGVVITLLLLLLSAVMIQVTLA